MAEYTPNLSLKKPSNSDYVRIADSNENMDVLDAEIKALQDAIEELEPVEVINDLNHTDADKALSANQGKILDGKISTLTGQVEDNEKSITYNAKRLDNLIKLSQGKIFDYQTDETEAYSKAVPLGSQQYGSLDMVGGKSLVYNQTSSTGLAYNGGSSSFFTVTVKNHILTATLNTPTETSSATAFYFYAKNVVAEPNHKIAVSFDVEMEGLGRTDGSQLQAWLYNTHFEDTPLTDIKNGRLFYQLELKADNAAGEYYSFRLYFDKKEKTYQENGYLKLSNFQSFDLTKMFGAGNEPTLEQCREIFSDGYYPYNAGEIMNFGVNEVESVGVNQSAIVVGGINSNTGEFIEATSSRRSDYFDATNGVSYQLFENGNVTTKTLQSFTSFYDANKNFISRGSGSQRAKEIWTASQVPTGAVYAAITLYENANNQLDIYQLNKSVQVMIKASDEAITEYIPYREETFTIPQSILNLPDYGASAGSVYNYIDFDRKVYMQNVGSVDLGALNWTTRTTGSVNIGYSVSLPYSYPSVNDSSASLLWTTNSTYNGGTTATEISSRVDEMDIGIYHYKTGSSTQTIYFIAPIGSTLSGKLNYRLETPIETDISDLIDNGLIFAEGGGTITFKNVKGDDYHIPVPSKETYMVKLADSI